MNEADHESCSERITFRCTPQFKAAVEIAAKIDKRKPSQWIVARLEEIVETQIEEGIVSRSPLRLREVTKQTTSRTIASLPDAERLPIEKKA